MFLSYFIFKLTITKFQLDDWVLCKIYKKLINLKPIWGSDVKWTHIFAWLRAHWNHLPLKWSTGPVDDKMELQYCIKQQQFQIAPCVNDQSKNIVPMVRLHNQIQGVGGNLEILPLWWKKISWIWWLDHITWITGFQSIIVKFYGKYG